MTKAREYTKQEVEEIKKYCDEFIHYNYVTGEFTWKKDRGYRYKKGDKAGSSTRDGYHSFQINGKSILAHRLAYLIIKGDMPPSDMVIDHIDGNKRNNRWKNLRLVTQQQNMWNRKTHKNNKSGYPGVSWYWTKKGGGWYSTITVKGKLKYLGYFKSKEDAINARKEAEKKRDEMHISDKNCNLVKEKGSITDQELYEIIKERYTYDPEMGKFYLKHDSPKSCFRTGDTAGSLCPDGRIRIRVKIGSGMYKSCYAHRLAFLYMTGSIPEVVDHINGDPSDNKWCNLRAATRSENMRNRKASGKSGVIGVRETPSGRWGVKVNRKYYGTYDTIEEAAEVSKKVREELHGEFSAFNREKVDTAFKK